MSFDGVTMRVHLGDEDQAPNPFIAAKMGEANTQAYRGTAYVFFEALPLERFGNRLRQLSFEVFRPILDGTSAESLVRAVTLIPASGEFAYATDVVRREVGDDTAPENVKAEADRADIVVALDRLEACAPKVESVSLVVAWFGGGLRAGHYRIRPGVEVSAKTTTPDNWSVDGVGRGSAHLVSRNTEDRPAYGGTPSDSAVVQAIHELPRLQRLAVADHDVPVSPMIKQDRDLEIAEVGVERPRSAEVRRVGRVDLQGLRPARRALRRDDEVCPSPVRRASGSTPRNSRFRPSGVGPGAR